SWRPTSSFTWIDRSTEVPAMRHPGLSTDYTRRDWLRRMGGGFGMLGLAGVLAGEQVPSALAAVATGGKAGAAANPLAPKLPHFAPRAKRVIFLFMNGGPSHVDAFDPKPMLDKHDGGAPPEGLKLGRKSGRALM